MARLLDEIEVQGVGLVCANLARHIGTHQGQCCASALLARAEDGMLIHMAVSIVHPGAVDKPLDDVPALIDYGTMH